MRIPAITERGFTITGSSSPGPAVPFTAATGTLSSGADGGRQIMPLAKLRWTSFGHVEADERGSGPVAGRSAYADVVHGPLARAIPLIDCATEPPAGCDRRPGPTPAGTDCASAAPPTKTATNRRRRYRRRPRRCSPRRTGYVFIETKSGQTRCQTRRGAVGCEALFANAPMQDGVPRQRGERDRRRKPRVDRRQPRRHPRRDHRLPHVQRGRLDDRGHQGRHPVHQSAHQTRHVRPPARRPAGGSRSGPAAPASASRRSKPSRAALRL